MECFTCITCHARLRGQPFYALDKKSYCESCYIVSQQKRRTSSSLRLWFKCLVLFQSTLERCSKCSKPILDRILRAMGKAYHPRCFTCVVCNCCLDGVPFTVDATSQIHCIEDFHRYDSISTPLKKKKKLLVIFCNVLAKKKSVSFAGSTRHGVRCAASPSCRSRVRRRRSG